MEFFGSSLTRRCCLLLLLLESFTSILNAHSKQDPDSPFGRSSFPAGFIFGTSSSAYQYEGAAREGGKGPSIWDTYTHQHPEKIADRSNGDVADDSYHRYKEDVHIMKDMGMDAYRFSISWPRILPNGSLSGGVNGEGVKYYNNLINELLSKGLTPFVTLFHWDTPQALEDHYGGFLSHHIINDYRDFAEVCFKEFGDRVKHWITFNEPYMFSVGGYALSTFAPGRCTPGNALMNCSQGDSGREPYIVAHHLLIAHSTVVKLYRSKYQASQKGTMGISLSTGWIVPYSNSKSNLDAAERALDFEFGWFMDPLTQGDYPFIMRAIVGDRLPEFTIKQSGMLKGSIDFVGINYYTSNYAVALPISNSLNKSVLTDPFTNSTNTRNGIPIGPQVESGWIYDYPQGIQDILVYTKEKYNNPIIYITENGVYQIKNATQSLQEVLKDETRISYHLKHMSHLHSAIRNGVDVRGYFVWTLLDAFEWASGFTYQFGLNYVDRKDDLKRYPKNSAIWFRNFLKY